ncbi:MAG: hypothetical protein HC781_05445 [Leptolyngbyaceae cyanobacterium CSU_1_4]|nr:hypothetical protein [Leptolyngbyaceae cyanobacterium CSU_1_4]
MLLRRIESVIVSLMRRSGRRVACSSGTLQGMGDRSGGHVCRIGRKIEGMTGRSSEMTGRSSEMEGAIGLTRRLR